MFPTSLCDEFGKPLTGNLLIWVWLDGNVPKSLCDKHGKAHTVSLLIWLVGWSCSQNLRKSESVYTLDTTAQKRDSEGARQSIM